MSRTRWDTKNNTMVTLSDGTRITKTMGYSKNGGHSLIKYSFEQDNVSIPNITIENNYPLWTMVHKLFLKEVQGVKDE